MRIMVRFKEEMVSNPITSEVILEHGVPLNILWAKVESTGGELLLEIPDEKANEIVNSFRLRGVEVLTGRLIDVSEELCVKCGACYSLCPIDAIELRDGDVIFNEDLCIGCGLCVDACPTKAIKLLKVDRTLK